MPNKYYALNVEPSNLVKFIDEITITFTDQNGRPLQMKIKLI